MLKWRFWSCRLSKGNQVKIPEPGRGYCSGNINELGDVGESPWKSSLFFLTAHMTLESDYPEIRLYDWQSISLFEVSGALSDDP